MLNLSLSGCGFLGIYHIGVISAFREHAPQFLQDKISGCSAGSLVAACAICDCCLGQMVSDVLEIALKARSYALGPLHPSFSIVEILRNGLRRILPVDAHKICSGRLHVSLTRWKDGKNFLVNQFDSREELIQALICSSFVPFYSGIVPPKFKGVYFWDGGLSCNNPILDPETITVTPFGGESDICPRDESGAFYCIDFQGTSVHWSHENIYRISKALFPPPPETLKAICFRGYKDAVSFLKSRNLLQCSCNRFFREKMSISSVFGDDININEYPMYEESEIGVESVYDSDEDKIIQFADSHEPLNYEEMPVSVCEILNAACDDNKGILYSLYNSQLSRFISIMFLPWTLPVEFSFNFTKKVLELVPKIKVSPNSSYLMDTLLIYLNYIIQKFTYDKYHYHARVTCKSCVSGSGDHEKGCCHSEIQNEFDDNMSDGKSSFGRLSYQLQPKLCARHRVPSICSSETGQYGFKKYRARSLVSYTSEMTSSTDLNDSKASKSYFARRKRSTLSQQYSNQSFKLARSSRRSFQSNDRLIPDESNTTTSTATTTNLNIPNKLINDTDIETDRSTSSKSRTRKESMNRVHFHLNHNNTDDEIEDISRIKRNDKPTIVDDLTNQKLFNSIDLDKENTTNLINPTNTSTHNHSHNNNINSINRYKLRNLTDDSKSAHNNNRINPIQENNTVSTVKLDNNLTTTHQLDNNNKVINMNYINNFTASLNQNTNRVNSIINTEKKLSSSIDLDNSTNNDSKTKFGWDSYWENLELNALGKINS